jgi:phosphatidylinositol-3-phosphatase
MATRIRAALGCLVVLIGLTLSGCVPTAGSAPAGTLPTFKHVVVVVLENKDYEEIVGRSSMPFFNSLAQQYGLATNYYGIGHPSLPNYLALTGGSTFGITSDCTDCTVGQPNIVDQLERGGKSWKAYIDAMPSPCYAGDAPPLYLQKHNPFIYYDSVRTNPDRCAKIVPFSQFAADLSAHLLPNYSWITPNMCDDGHDCPANSADAWLRAWVPKIIATPEWQDAGALFITFDEGHRSTLFPGSCCIDGNGGHVATLVISPLGKPGYRSAVAYDHYSLLRTIELGLGLPELGGAACACAPAMADFFVQPAPGAP